MRFHRIAIAIAGMLAAGAALAAPGPFNPNQWQQGGPNQWQQSGPGQWQQGAGAPDLAAIKQRILSRIQQRQAMLSQRASCVQAAQSMQALRQCRPPRPGGAGPAGPQ